MNNQRGFTITELLVVVAVLGLLTTVSLTYSQRSGQQIILFREQAQLTEEVLRARNFSVQRYRPQDRLECGYGISFIDSNTYAIFSDAPLTATCPGDRKMGSRADGSSEGFAELQIDDRVWIDSSGGYEDIFFSPTDGFVYFDGVRAQPGQEARVSLVLGSTGQRVNLVINYLGQIYTE